MIETILSIFQDYTFQIVALGTGVLGLMGGVIGSFTTLQKESLLGDALSHAALPGILIGFMLAGRKEWAFLLGGTTISGLIATFLIQWMSKRGNVKFDNTLSLVLSSFFGFGLVLMTYLQKTPDGDQAGISNFIYGQASTMLLRDVQVLVFATIISIALVLIFWKELKVYTFDSQYAKTLGFNTTFLQLLLSLIMIVTIILGLESVGVILMSALLVGPAVAARQWTNHLSVMVTLAGIFGFLSGVIGTLISSLYTQIPTGSTIVLVLSFFTFFSLFLSPNRGIIARRLLYKKRKKEYAIFIQEQKKKGEDKSYVA